MPWKPNFEQESTTDLLELPGAGTHDVDNDMFVTLTRAAKPTAPAALLDRGEKHSCSFLFGMDMLDMCKHVAA